MIKAGDEERVLRGLLDVGLLSWVHEDEVFRVIGRPCLNGLFAVPKLKSAFDKPETAPQRLIMNLTAANSRQVAFAGDMGMLPNFCSWRSLYLLEGVGLSWSAEDMQSAFYLFSMPVQWRKYLAFDLSRHNPAGQSRPGLYYAVPTVLPMGWASAMAVMQCVHRRVIADLGPGSGLLPLERQIRRDKALPRLSVSSSARSAWQVYCDDFDVLTYKELEKAATSEEALETASEVVEYHKRAREAYDSVSLPTSRGKALESHWTAKRLGAFINGRVGYMCVPWRRLFSCLWRGVVVTR
jgi:hypothetical protein